MSKYLKYVPIFIAIIVIASLFSVKGVIAKSVQVVDGDTGTPVSNATVTYQYSNWSTGCGDAAVVTTDSKGRSSSPKKSYICAVSAIAPGYHINGSNTALIPRIKIYRQLQNDQPLPLAKAFKKNEGMDVLSYIANFTTSITQAIKPVQSNDFLFTELASTEITTSHGDTAINGEAGIAHMRFFGEGGVQEISDVAAIHTGGEYYFDMENMRIAPDKGFEKELDIVPGKPYVAKLRDGQHYMKFHIFAWKDTSTHTDKICMTAFINPNVGKSVDFLGTSETTFCNGDRLPDDYAKKMTYKKFQQDFSGTIIAKKYDANVTSMGDANGYRYLMNYNSPTGSSLDDIVYNYTFTTAVPSFEEFSQKFDENKGGGQIPLFLLLAHGDNIYKALVNVPIYGFERDPNTGAPHSTKELCDRALAGASFTSPEIKNQVFNKCLTHSFGYN